MAKQVEQMSHVVLVVVICTPSSIPVTILNAMELSSILSVRTENGDRGCISHPLDLF